MDSVDSRLLLETTVLLRVPLCLLFKILGIPYLVTQSDGAAEYTDCISAEG